MTHFASAADYTPSQTADQLAYFHGICEALGSRRRAAVPHLHTSSTNAIGYGRTEGWHNLVRAGHALYGYVSPAARRRSRRNCSTSSPRSPGKPSCSP